VIVALSSVRVAKQRAQAKIYMGGTTITNHACPREGVLDHCPNPRTKQDVTTGKENLEETEEKMIATEGI